MLNRVNLYTHLSIDRYQWSVGYTEKSTPEGIFNQATERIWHDAARNMKQIYQTEHGMFLSKLGKLSRFLIISLNSLIFIIEVERITCNVMQIPSF